MELVTSTIGYVEFHLDVNQNKNNDGPSGPSLDNVQLFISTNSSARQAGATACSVAQLASTTWMPGINRAILLDYVLNKGSGNGYDMQLLVPVSVFGNFDPSVANYVYLYSSFGAVRQLRRERRFRGMAYRTCGAGTRA